MASLLVASSSVKLAKDPRRPTEGSLRLNVVRVWEPEPPEDEKGLEWLLYTSEPVDTPEQMFQVVDWYRARWCIEEYFKALKPGCGMEKRQLGELHALANTMALLAPIAWKLLLLKSEARARPDEPATKILEQEELEVLLAASRTPLTRDCTTEGSVARHRFPRWPPQAQREPWLADIAPRLSRTRDIANGLATAPFH